MPDDPTQQGRWEPPFALPDAAIHTAVLATGKVLAWGRRKDPAGSMHQVGCAPFLWDPVTGEVTPTAEPRRADGSPVNLFCSGHAFLPDGRLLVAGGHITDGDGLDQACVYDPWQATWTALPALRSGRWYPSALTLTDGRVLVISGSHQDGEQQPIETVPEVWDGTSWQATRDFVGLPLYPRVFVAPDGRIVMAGSNPETKTLDIDGVGTWTPPPGPAVRRRHGDRQYGPAVMYAPGRVLYVGGGNDLQDGRPTDACERIDLTDPAPTWEPAASMRFRRRQHNATLLPDGTVLVTGGTSGPGFNDLTPGAPIRAAELWDPVTDTWTTLAEESVDRCYHSTAVLLPDATVLSAGGGEFVEGGQPNAPTDTHRDAQVFHPPYLFRGPRPTIVGAPDRIAPGETMRVAVVDEAGAVLTLVRASSTTHTFNADQRFLRLETTSDASDLVAALPDDAAECPPGSYLLFVLSAAGVPSLAHPLRVETSTAVTSPAAAEVRRALPAPTPAPTPAPESGTAVTIGLTAQCPYGLGPCWGGAYSALARLDDVAWVDPVPDQVHQTARVRLTHEGLPDVARWPEQFARWANASYAVRGVETTLVGALVDVEGGLFLETSGGRLQLCAVRPGTQLSWDLERGRRRPMSAQERAAYRDLLGLHPDGELVVTGPLRLRRGRPVLSVRSFETRAG